MVEKHFRRAVPALVLGLVAAGVVQAQSNVVKIDGSSTVYPITEAVAEEFQKAEKNAVKVTVGISGTGGGFKKFCSWPQTPRRCVRRQMHRSPGNSPGRRQTAPTQPRRLPTRESR